METFGSCIGSLCCRNVTTVLRCVAIFLLSVKPQTKGGVKGEFSLGFHQRERESDARLSAAENRFSSSSSLRETEPIHRLCDVCVFAPSAARDRLCEVRFCTKIRIKQKTIESPIGGRFVRQSLFLFDCRTRRRATPNHPKAATRAKKRERETYQNNKRGVRTFW